MSAYIPDPRIQVWSDHFKVENAYIVGLTAIGLTTVFLLQMNEFARLQLRQSLIDRGLYPNLL
jgi:hypothetical protein